MTAAAVIAGSLGVLVVVVDVWLTVLHPTLRGPLSYRVERLAWRGVRALLRRSHRLSVMGFAGPAAMLAGVAVWTGGLWLAYALVYLPFVDESLTYSAAVPFGARGISEALYLSGASLATLGFGDVVASTDGLRLVTVLEAASGFAVISGAISYVISVYPQVSVARSVASRLSDAGVDGPAGAARLALHGGPTELARLHADLIAVQQSLRRFPVLYLFHAGRPDESLARLFRSVALVALQLGWGLRYDGRPYLDYYAAALTAALRRVLADVACGFIGGPRDVLGDPARTPPGDAAAALSRLRAGAAAVDAAVARDDASDLEEFAELLALCRTFLLELERRHEHAPAALLEAGG